MVQESGLSFEKYLQQVRTECQEISHWPIVDGKPNGKECDGYCPFDMTPGYLALVLGHMPSWALSFREKGMKPDGVNLVEIPLTWKVYGHLTPFSNARKQEFAEWDLDTELKDFLGTEECTLKIERELLKLDDKFPPIFVERLVAINEEDELSVWGLGIVRELAIFETHTQSDFVFHAFGVEPYTYNEYGLHQNWYMEHNFIHPIDSNLLNFPNPISLNEGEFIAQITRREAQSC